MTNTPTIIYGLTDQSLLNTSVKVAVMGLAYTYLNIRKLVEGGGFMAKKDLADLSSEDYSMALRPLRKRLVFFKTEMHDAMTDLYFPLRDAELFNSRALAAYIAGEIKRLRRAVSKFNSVVPENEIKAVLGIHLRLHDELPSLNAEMIIQYFALNYMLRQV